MKFNPDALRNAMLLKQYTIDQLAVITGCKRGTIGTVLSGRCNKSTAIAPLCKALGVRIKDCYQEVSEAISA